MIQKANSSELKTSCPDIKWHFIGHLQKKKINKLLTISNLYLIETIDSIELAESVNKSWMRIKSQEKPVDEIDLLNIMIQVNTSDEERKF